MRKIMIMLFLCLTFIFQNISHAANWTVVDVDVNSNTREFIDVDSIFYARSISNTPINHLIDFWLKEELSESKKEQWIQRKKNSGEYSSKWDNLSSAKAKMRINIDSREIATTQVIFYDIDGNVLSSQSESPNYVSIPPDSKGERYFHVIKYFITENIVQ